MPNYFKEIGYRDNGLIETDEHKEEAERLKGGPYRPQKRNEFIPVEDLRSRGLSPEEELIAKEERKTNEGQYSEIDDDKDAADEKQGESSEWRGDYPDGQSGGIYNDNNAKDEEALTESPRQEREAENTPKKEPINPQQAAGWDAKKYNPNYWSHGKRGRKREWPKSLKARKRFNEIEKESLEKAKKME